MTFIEFKKLLLDADITLPKFAKLIRVSEKNLQSYKKKEEIPNPIAVIAKSFAIMHLEGIDYKNRIDTLNLEKKSKDGVGFQKNPENVSHKKKKKSKEKEEKVSIESQESIIEIAQTQETTEQI
jgi:hypothetical protein